VIAGSTALLEALVVGDEKYDRTCRFCTMFLCFGEPSYGWSWGELDEIYSPLEGYVEDDIIRRMSLIYIYR